MATHRKQPSQRSEPGRPEDAGADSPTSGEITVEATGGGWYEVKLNGIVMDKVQGRRAADAAVTRIQMERG